MKKILLLSLLLCLAIPVPAQTIVQRPVEAACNATGCSLGTFASNVTAGNAIVVFFLYRNAGNLITSVTDTSSNTYTLTAGNLFQASVGYNKSIWVACNIAGGVKPTVTANLSSSASSNGFLVEVGSVATSCIDQCPTPASCATSTANAGAAHTVFNSPSATTLFANEIVVGYGATNGAISPGNGGDTVDSFNCGPSPCSATFRVWEYKTVTSKGSYTSQFTSTAANDQMLALVTTLVSNSQPVTTKPYPMVIKYKRQHRRVPIVASLTKVAQN